MAIKENLEKIKNNVAFSCDTSGRDKRDVTILAVTKTRTVSEISHLVGLGVRDLGENRVQEFLDKYPHIDSSVRWHIIGHLQTNKVKYIADKVYMIHSVDSLKLAKEIDKHCRAIGKVMNILIEVNSGEENKDGISYELADELIYEVSKLSNVKICGLMTMAPLGADERTLRRVFSNLYKLSVDIAGKKYDNVSMKELSMGMSSDYTIAIEEGATIIRPGRALFN